MGLRLAGPLKIEPARSASTPLTTHSHAHGADSQAHPFYDAEVYHQAHCDFSMSAGMPYPSSYTADVWHAHQRDGGAYANLWAPTGCPESYGSVTHPGFLCQSR